MDNSSRPDEELRANGRLAYEMRDALDAAMADVLRSCNKDKLARYLGLSHDSQAENLIDHPAALSRLAQRLGDGCEDMPLAEAVGVTRAMLGDADIAS